MLSGHGTGIQREPLHFYSYWCKYECMYVVFLLNKKHCFGYIIHVWCLIPVTYVSGKLHLYKYVAWCMKYSVTGNKSCVYIHFIPPPTSVERGGGPVSNMWLGFWGSAMKFTGAELLRSSNVMGEMDKQAYKTYIPCTRQQQGTQQIAQEKNGFVCSIRKILIERIRHSVLITNNIYCSY